MTTYSKIGEEDARRLCADAASVAADVFRAQGWGIRGVEGAPGEEQLADAILELLRGANTVKRPFHPWLQRDRLKVEVFPDLAAAQVWLRVGDLSLHRPEQDASGSGRAAEQE